MVTWVLIHLPSDVKRATILTLEIVLPRFATVGLSLFATLTNSLFDKIIGALPDAVPNGAGLAVDRGEGAVGGSAGVAILI